MAEKGTAGGTGGTGGKGTAMPVVDLLPAAWATLIELLEGLPDEAWERPALPGWDVHDVVAHIIGGERMLAGDERPDVAEGADAGGHIRNPVAKLNEAWVVALRERTHEELLDDLRQVTAARTASLRAMTPEELAAPSWTPAGDADYQRFMQIRVFDCYMHEQDIREATGVAGHEDGPVAEASLAEVVGALGYIVGKRVGAPDGTSVTIHLTGPITEDLHVAVDGRARRVARLDGPPTAAISLPSPLFLRLTGGRMDPEAALDRVVLEGEPELARRLATSLAYTI